MSEGEADFRLFRELCDAFNDLGRIDLRIRFIAITTDRQEALEAARSSE
jgi:hypothetical protein